MKKILSLVTIFIVCAFVLCGCKVDNTDEENISPQFIKLEEFNSASGLCYDKDTKVIYLYSMSGAFNARVCYSYTPYYVMNMNNESVIAIYNGDITDE